ncbi:dienelactone hydrolase family protein [Luteolibacter flavescens]|uniref:Dienelactone hydrolase family protein n=1 Tax=Luteolibacter flavescens TaxID=1859460 RepID=A0ABT3FP23_9BACT|nr:dienelactone hydrolase family protein [Luteolibacter flavescens]MCW1885287.1 dienelactone hydrolase family protein [Luteolibacter flavescens]
MKTLLLSLMAAASASAAIVEKTVEYQHDGVTLEGYHVYDDAVEGKRPAVLVIHQWTGLSDYEKERSRQLAGLGYNVFAADIYGKGIRPVPPAAGQEAGKYKGDRKLFRGRLDAGLAELKKDERTDASKIAAVGYCFGGTGVLELARSGADIAGVVSFHGGLDAAEGLGATKGGVKAKVLVCHGAVDPYVPAEQVTAFGKEMEDSGADWQLLAYGHAVHSFTQKKAGDDPSKGSAYNEKADKRSWEAMKSFFAEIFGK